MTAEPHRPTYSLFWDFLLLATSASAWLMLAVLFRVLLRETGSIGWNVIAMWPIGAAFMPLLFIVLLDFTTRIRHRTITVALTTLSLIGVVCVLGVMHFPGLRDSVVLSDLKNGSAIGFAHDKVEDHLADDPTIGKEVLRDATLTSRLERELEPHFAVDPTSGTWPKQMTRAVWRSAGRKSRGGALLTDSTRPSERRVLLALLGAEARPDPALDWIGSVIRRAPSGSFRLGLTNLAEARPLAGQLAAAGDLTDGQRDALLFAATQHPGLLTSAELDALLASQRVSLATRGLQATFEIADGLRRELVDKYRGQDVAVFLEVHPNLTKSNTLRYAMLESVRGLLRSAGLKVSETEASPKIVVGALRGVVGDFYQDQLVLAFGLDGEPAALPSSSLPVPVAPYLASPVIELPVVLTPADKQVLWLYGIPLFYFDVTPRKLREAS